MPKAKKTSETKGEKKVAKKIEKKPKTKTKSLVKKIKPVKKNKVEIEEEKVLESKARPVIIDVIEDEDDNNFFPDLPSKIESSEEDEDVEGDKVLDDKIENLEEKNIINEKIEEKVPENESHDIDQQKNFFTQLVTEIKDKDTNQLLSQDKKNLSADDQNSQTPKSIGLYRRLAWRFLAFTAILLLAVSYFSFSKLTILISPKGEEINDSLLLKVTSNNSAEVENNNENDFRDLIPGTVSELIVNAEKTFVSSGEEFVGEEVSGKVKIINNSAKAQALVAKTRLLSPEGKLYRIKEAVNAPANGEIEVEIYVDKASEDLAISPSTFTIPGLWLGLQDKIYAKSSEAFVYRQKVKKYIKASDLEQANSEINSLLVAKAKMQEKELSKDDIVLYENLDSANFEIDSKVGEAKEQFTIKASSSLAIINFSKSAVTKLASTKLSLLVPDDKELVGYDSENIVYTLDNYDRNTGVATIKASFRGTMILKNDTEIIDKKQLVNLNRSQLENYLKTFPEIKSYEFKFFPSFITRAPRLPEKINIEIKGLEK